MDRHAALVALGTDANVLDRIAYFLQDPEWGVGMLEDIAELVRTTGRSTETRYQCACCELPLTEPHEAGGYYLGPDGTEWCVDASVDEGEPTEHDPEPIDTWSRH